MPICLEIGGVPLWCLKVNLVVVSIQRPAGLGTELSWSPFVSIGDQRRGILLLTQPSQFVPNWLGHPGVRLLENAVTNAWLAEPWHAHPHPRLGFRGERPLEELDEVPPQDPFDIGGGITPCRQQVPHFLQIGDRLQI